MTSSSSVRDDDPPDTDRAALRALVERQFRNLSWPTGKGLDASAFAADSLPADLLHPAARPVTLQSVQQFAARMQEQSRTTITSFDETVLGCQIEVFGAIAVAIADAEMLENGAPTRSVEMLLPVKTDRAWRIAAQTWDRASDTQPIPLPWRNGS